MSFSRRDRDEGGCAGDGDGVDNDRELHADVGFCDDA